MAQGNAITRNVKRWLENRAIARYQQAVELNPNEVHPHLILAGALLLYQRDAEGVRRAKAEFESILRLDPNNEAAITHLASLNYREAQDIKDRERKFRKLDESALWYERALALDPKNKEAHYSLGVIAWLKFYSEILDARARLGMQADEPGPLTDPALRKELQERWEPVVQAGISRLQTALSIDPTFADAIAYMNLIIRYAACLADTPQQYRRDVETAERWARKARALKTSTA